MATISFKVSDEEARLIRARARQERLSVSEYLRRRAVASTEADVPVKLSRCPLTGATIFDGAEGLPELTVASTRELLGDFP